jgi:cyclohexadienyl dehydratase
VRTARLLAVLLAFASCASGPARTPPGETLRIGTSGDYAPFSHGDASAPDGLAGFDVELVRRFAAERGARLARVRFRWPELAADLRAGRFDVALGGVTVRRSGRVAHRRSRAGAVVLVRTARRRRRSGPQRRRASRSRGRTSKRVARARPPAAP